MAFRNSLNKYSYFCLLAIAIHDEYRKSSLLYHERIRNQRPEISEPYPNGSR